MNSIKIIKKWNELSPLSKRAFGDKWITHESNLEAWNKSFNKLSPLKQKRILNCQELIGETRNFIG